MATLQFDTSFSPMTVRALMEVEHPSSRSSPILDNLYTYGISCYVVPKSSQKKRKAVDVSQASQGCIGPLPSLPTARTPKRARFEPKRREQVADIRKKGACMRCRLKKLSVGKAGSGSH